MFNDAGRPSEQGTVEGWWASPTLYRVVYTSPSYTGTELRNTDGFFRTAGPGSETSLSNLMLRQVIHPMPSENEIKSAKLEEQTESFGKVKLDCVMLGAEIKGLDFSPFGLFPMYCMDQNSSSLRLSFEFGDLAITRNRMGKFLERTVPLNISANSNGKLLVTGKVTVLQTAQLTAADFVPSDALVKVEDAPAKLAAGVLAGHIIKASQVQPTYPPDAKAKHISGTVVLRALIGRDGHIYHLIPVSYPSGDLAVSALTAVRHWAYTPYLLNGEPTEVDTTIKVNYDFH